MSTRTPESITALCHEFAGAYVAEGRVAQVARSLAYEIGLTPVQPGVGAMLRLLAAAGAAKAVVEIGTGTGVSGLWLLAGMRSDGILTTIDVEAEHQRMARRIFAEAGYPPSRTRIIAGRALDVLPRLADGVYDMLVVDGEPAEHAAGVSAGLRLLRKGGILVLHGVLVGGRIADPAARDPQTVAFREVVKQLRDAEEWTPALIPAGSGMLTAIKR
jgi:predicted O-methyltransferase YrrM